MAGGHTSVNRIGPSRRGVIRWSENESDGCEDARDVNGGGRKDNPRGGRENIGINDENVRIVTAGGTTSLSNDDIGVKAGRHTSDDDGDTRTREGRRRKKKQR